MKIQMKHIALHISLLISLLTLAACGSKVVIDDERTFGGNVWNRFSPEVFEIDLSNTDDYFNIDIAVSIDTARFRYDMLPLTVNLYSPGGEHRFFYADMPLKEKGRWKGEMTADGYRVVQRRVRPFFSFNGTGTHRIEIGQGTSQYDLEGVRSVRLYVENTKVDYDDL